MNEDTHITRKALKTPRAAAIAGILFALLFSTSMVLIRISIPSDLTQSSDWLETGANTVATALGIVPYAGIAFLWFIGVIRDRLGDLEDRFLSSVFLGSGLLFLGLTFTSAALTGGLLYSYPIESGKLIESGLFTYSRYVIFQITNLYAIRMASVFMLSLGTTWVRTRVMPRWLVFLTYALALVLLVGIGFSLWMTIIFPGWVLIISVFILVENYRRRSIETTGSLLT
jgi:hypothetical protein